MKKGILAVSFGTSHIDTMEKTIDVARKGVLQKRLKKLLYTGRLQAI